MSSTETNATWTPGILVPTSMERDQMLAGKHTSAKLLFTFNKCNRCATSNHYCFTSNHSCFTSHQLLCHFQTSLPIRLASLPTNPFRSQSFLLHFPSIAVPLPTILVSLPIIMSHCPPIVLQLPIITGSLPIIIVSLPIKCCATSKHSCFTSHPSCFTSNRSVSLPIILASLPTNRCATSNHSCFTSNNYVSLPINRCATSNHYWFACNHYCFTSHQLLCHFQSFLIHQCHQKTFCANGFEISPTTASVLENSQPTHAPTLETVHTTWHPLFDNQ